MSTLSPPVLFRLDHACKPIAEAFGHEPYLVGSVQERKASALSDVDVRLILPDDEYDALDMTPARRTLMDLALGAFLRELTGLPIDLQIQRQTEANLKYHGQRNPLGRRDLTAWVGDSSMSPAERLAERTRSMRSEVAEAILADLDEMPKPKKRTPRSTP